MKGASDAKGQNIQILVTKQGLFFSDFYNLREPFSKADC